MGRSALEAVLALALCAGCGRFAFDPIGGSNGGDAGLDTVTDGAGDSDLLGWWDPGWSRRVKLTFDNVGQSLAGFPVMVRLDSTRFEYTASNGQDLRFIDADGTTVLAHEIDRWTDNGTSIVWVHVPMIDASTADHMWLYYGKVGAPNVADPAGVWTGYALVWHLGEDPTASAPQIIDSTGNGNRGTTVGGIAAGAQGIGQIGGSVGLDGADDYITAPNSASLRLNGDLTITSWIRIGASRGQWLCDFVTPQSEQEINNHLYELAIDSGNRIELQWEYGSGLDTNVQSSIALASPLDTWVMITATRNATTNRVRFYENGAQLGLVESYTNNATGGTASTLWVSGEIDPSSSKLPLVGRQDEFRISGVAAPSEWIAAEYRSMTDAMILYGATERY